MAQAAAPRLESDDPQAKAIAAEVAAGRFPGLIAFVNGVPDFELLFLKREMRREPRVRSFSSRVRAL